ncbi:MAG: alpha-1,2-fucosyltransferase [Mycoplasmoidaceae bacterium]|nr:MAG: alpha-1,2-fucosyltransferase [Mycoplasmoidaceae bacterium]
MDITNIELNNSIMFVFAGGLGDQILGFAAFYKTWLKNKTKKFIVSYAKAAKWTNDKYKKHETFQLLKYPLIKKFFSDNNIKIQHYEDGFLIDDEYENLRKFTDNGKKVHSATYPKKLKTTSIIKSLDYRKNDLKKIHNFFSIPSEIESKQNLAILNSITSTNSVCVHFRLADTWNQKIFTNNLDTIFQWYKEKMLSFPQEFTFFIFSDQISYAKDTISSFNIDPSRIKYVDINGVEDAPLEFSLILSCKNFIIGWGGFSNLAWFFRAYRDGITFKYVPWNIDFLNPMNFLWLFDKCGSVEYLRYAYKKRFYIRGRYKKNTSRFIAKHKFTYTDQFGDKKIKL